MFCKDYCIWGAAEPLLSISAEELVVNVAKDKSARLSGRKGEIDQGENWSSLAAPEETLQIVFTAFS